MPKTLKIALLTFILALGNFFANAQDSLAKAQNALTEASTAITEDKPEMADVMRSNGKIYVVVAVVLTILLGIFLYLVRLEKKISKLEKE